MSITIGSNINSLRAKRLLGDATEKLGSVYERLASGQRINRAVDDAAGLAIASGLNSDRRVLHQAIRNVNDGISLLNIGDGALETLSDIVIRQKELAEQSANGTFSLQQRTALQQEYDALTREYNRIIATTDFNGIGLFNPDSTAVSLQVGKESSDSLLTDYGGELVRDVGTGLFEESSKTSSNVTGNTSLGDIDGDGLSDIVNDNGTLFLSNGDGSFAEDSFDIVSTNFVPGLPNLIDVNEDGNLDIIHGGILEVTSSSGSFILETHLGNGDGTFQTSQTRLVETGIDPTFSSLDGLEIKDFDGDGLLDAIFSTREEVFEGTYVRNVRFLKGDGNGAFQSPQLISSPSSGIASLYSADFDNDGNEDLIFGNDLNQVQLGNGDGTFREGESLGFATTTLVAVTFEDFNRDGVVDAASTAGEVRLGNGDGTFRAEQSFNPQLTGTRGVITATDINGDGLWDLFITGLNQIENRLVLGLGNGTFGEAITVNDGSGRILSSANAKNRFVDFNGDGVMDSIESSSSDFSGSVIFGVSGQTSNIAYDSIFSEESARAALDKASERLEAISRQRATLGASQSRLGSALKTLETRTGVLAQAESRIIDADIARDAAQLTRLQILQQAAAAVLAQANVQPTLAVTLLQ